ncbi:MAG TPA: hypothetical protein PLU49_11195, partial [Saprospiraceae bacterium]|nr:hypothetical protein [Saprospiraceae bacterium]
CENAIDQIHTYAVTDDRFKLIIAKLKRLDSHTSKWTDGNYDFDTLGLDCSPDTKKRIYDTLNFRTIGCPEIGPVVFSWHIKWYFSGQSFRMYIHPQASNHKMYIGYIGDKKGMGF